MNRFLFLFFTVAVVFVAADDDGQYRPGKYGDDGRYRAGDEGRYNGLNGAYFADRSRFGFIPSASSLQPIRPAILGRVPVAPIVKVKPASFITAPVVTPHYVSKDPNAQSRILKFENDNLIDEYNFAYENDNGIQQGEQGKIFILTPDEQVMRTKGFYQYVGPDNVVYRVDYIADENGFQPIGAHLPKA